AGLRVPPALEARRGDRPGRLPPLGPQRGRRAELYAAAAVRTDQEPHLGGAPLFGGGGAPGRDPGGRAGAAVGGEEGCHAGRPGGGGGSRAAAAGGGSRSRG